ncbi:MAG: hypothetical protein HY544_00315 [Candidatus Diapherotrites archaeon]|uniref:Uncharacterized protein n=1 Tax=Candidatus Iainarchaeum sp. TaxID=3101447 RepID=A0A8T3YK26_9ARCH|nr:hypothetical protein [Candidatus Diapherotrites archaeon]
MKKGKARMEFEERHDRLLKPVIAPIMAKYGSNSILIRQRIANASAVVAELTRGWTKNMLNRPIGKIIAIALRAKKIRRVAEIGASRIPLFGPFESALGEAGAETTFIQRRVTDLPSATGKFDLIISQGVYTSGGYDRQGMQRQEIVRKSTEEIIRQVQMLSDNPNARVIITPLEDPIIADREQLEQNCEIVRWDSRYPLQQGNQAYGYSNLPTLLILKKRQGRKPTAK